MQCFPELFLVDLRSLAFIISADGIEVDTVAAQFRPVCLEELCTFCRACVMRDTCFAEATSRVPGLALYE